MPKRNADSDGQPEDAVEDPVKRVRRLAAEAAENGTPWPDETLNSRLAEAKGVSP